MTRIKKSGHVVLYVRNAVASADWYVYIPGMDIVISNPRMPSAFLSFGGRDHNLALFGIDDRRPVGGPDFNRVAFEIDGDPDDLPGA